MPTWWYQVRALQRLGAEHAVLWSMAVTGMDEVSMGAPRWWRGSGRRHPRIRNPPEDLWPGHGQPPLTTVETLQQFQAMLLGVLDNRRGRPRTSWPSACRVAVRPMY